MYVVSVYITFKFNNESALNHLNYFMKAAFNVKTCDFLSSSLRCTITKTQKAIFVNQISCADLLLKHIGLEGLKLNTHAASR